MAPKAHAFLGFSSSGHWGKCALYAHMNHDFPTPGGIDAEEGTAAHEVVELITAGRAPNAIAENGVPVTEEMIEGAELWMQTVAPSMGESVHIEETLPVTRVHPTHCWGTPDYWSYSQREAFVHVVEYKFGRRYVPAFQNSQLILQGAAALEKLGVDGYAEQYIRMKFEVVQPRWFGYQGKVSTWECNATDLRAHLNLLTMAAENATRTLPADIGRPATPGPEQCYKCPGRLYGRCPALAQASALASEYVSMVSKVGDLSVENACHDLKHLYRIRRLLEHRIEGLEEQVLLAAERGERTPFFRAGDSKGRMNWGELSVDQVIRMGDTLGMDLRKQSVVTPAQARKMGLSDEMVDAVTGRKTERVLIEMDQLQALSKISN